MFRENKVLAFLDDFNEINIISDIIINKVVLVIDGQKKVLYTGYNHGNLCVNFDFPLVLNEEYDVHINDCFYVPMVKRGVVQTSKFDELFKYDGVLGHVYRHDKTVFKLWAPVASAVFLKLFKGSSCQLIKMEYTNGVYHCDVLGDVKLYEYLYVVYVNGEVKEVVDPYAIASTLNGKSSVVVDVNELKATNDYVKKPGYEPVITEFSVNDFTSDKDANFVNKGKFLGTIERGVTNKSGDMIGFDYIKKMGYDYVQLMPFYDFGSVDEVVESDQNYNWGYDPVQYNVCEGSYVVDTCPSARISEACQMIDFYHQHQIGVIMDVVYNHVYDANTFSFNQITPYYFCRYDDDYNLYNGSYCGNEVASERLMVRKFIIDSMKLFVEVYKVDGFRIDLMGLMDIETINQVSKVLRAINPDIIIYGEGWDLPSGLASNERATQLNADKLPDIGFFDDDFRDYVKGNNSKFEELGIINQPDNQVLIDLVMSGVNISQIKPYLSTDQLVRYVSCHDDHTLFDYISLVDNTDVHAKIKKCYDYIFNVNGIKFVHLGCEFLRSKEQIKNTYNASKQLNAIKWDDVTINKDVVLYVKTLIDNNKL